MAVRTSGRRRSAAALGTVLVAAVLATGASVVGQVQQEVQVDGSHNILDLRVTGSLEPGWEPDAEQWSRSEGADFLLGLGGRAVAPGDGQDFRVAVLNDSPSLAALLSLEIHDPHPRGDAVDPETGTFQELFGQLRFTVRDGQTVLLDRVRAQDLTAYRWSEPLAAGEQRVLDVRVEMDEETDNRWQRATTDLTFEFQAVNE